jgi:hypothetical protein
VVLRQVKAAHPHFEIRQVSPRVGSPLVDEPSLHDPI